MLEYSRAPPVLLCRLDIQNGPDRYRGELPGYVTTRIGGWSDSVLPPVGYNGGWTVSPASLARREPRISGITNNAVEPNGQKKADLVPPSPFSFQYSEKTGTALQYVIQSCFQGDKTLVSVRLHQWSVRDKCRQLIRLCPS